MTEQQAILEAITDVRTMLRDHVQSSSLHIDPETWQLYSGKLERIVDTLDGASRTRLDGTKERYGGMIADMAQLKERNGLTPLRLSRGSQAWIATLAAAAATIIQTVARSL